MRCFGVQCVGHSSRMEIIRRDAHTFPVQKALLSVGFLLSAPVVDYQSQADPGRVAMR